MKIIDKIIGFLFHFLFFVLPLFFLFNTSELFEFNKMLLIYALTSIIGFFWFLKMILTKKILIKKSFLDIPLILFLISQIISTIFSIDPHTSFFGYYGRFNGGLLSIICYIFLYYAFISNNINVYSVLKISLISSFFVILYAIPGKLGHDLTCFLASKGEIIDNSCWDNSILQFQPHIRAFSTLGQPNWFGAYLAVNFFIGIYYLFQNSNIKNQKFISNIKYFFILVYLFFNFSFILFTRSRSAFLAVFIGILLFIIHYLFFIKKNFIKIVVIFLFIILIPIFIFKTGIEKIDRYLFVLNIKKESNIDKKINETKKQQNENINITDSADIRKIVWKGALELGLKYPFFGTGVETFAYSYNFVRPIEHNYTSEWDFVYNKAHNEYLNYLATTGFFGLFSYLFLILSFVFYFISNIFAKSKIKKKEDILFLKISLFISYITILITNFFGFSITVINLFFYLIPGFIFLLKNKKEEQINNYYLNIKNISFFQFFSILIFSVFLFYLLFSVFNYYKADVYYSLGNNYLKLFSPDYKKSTEYFQKALKKRFEHVYQDKLSSNFAYFSALTGFQKDSTLSSQFINISYYYNQKSLEFSPKNIFYLKTKAKNQYYYYLATSDVSYLFEAINVLNISRKLAPTDPKIPYNLAVFYLEIEKNEKNQEKKKYYRQKAIEEIKNSLFLKKDFIDAKNLLTSNN
ncbi:MAG: O-antigen ligase family protein [Patescibacteria group bacterium]|nr:O-antigen ligase family protein [Patescibacteria group bacterium]